MKEQEQIVSCQFHFRLVSFSYAHGIGHPSLLRYGNHHELHNFDASASNPLG